MLRSESVTQWPYWVISISFWSYISQGKLRSSADKHGRPDLRLALCPWCFCVTQSSPNLSQIARQFRAIVLLVDHNKQLKSSSRYELIALSDVLFNFPRSDPLKGTILSHYPCFWLQNLPGSPPSIDSVPVGRQHCMNYSCPLAQHLLSW